jgi:hypothetical protein
MNSQDRRALRGATLALEPGPWLWPIVATALVNAPEECQAYAETLCATTAPMLRIALHRAHQRGGYLGASTVANAITHALKALADADRVDAAQCVEKCVTHALRHDADIYGATLRALKAEWSRQ